MSDVMGGILNDYSIKPKNLLQYTAFRGLTDFTNIGQFDQFETGYSFLCVVSMPKFIQEIAKADSNYADLVNSFEHMLEYEFRGMDGLEDIQAETLELTDGINSVNMINKVTKNHAVTVSMNYFEKRGSLIQKFTEMYLTGIKDGDTQAKSYHGMIKRNLIEPGYENEVFTMMYIVTDNTMLNIEKSVLLTNMQLTKSQVSQFNSERGTYGNVEVNLEFNAYAIYNAQVDKAARFLLDGINGVEVTKDQSGTNKYNEIGQYIVKSGTKTQITEDSKENGSVLNTGEFTWGIMDSRSEGITTANGTLASIIDGTLQ
mgnify:CR=1 FL=1